MSSALLPWGVMLIVAVASALTAMLYRHVALRRTWFDHPNARSAHSAPVPTGGGIAIVLALGLGVALQFPLLLQESVLLWILGLSSALSVVGLLDDRRGLSVRIRLLAQVLLAFAVATLLLPWQGVLLPLAVLLLVGCANAFNFMDGIDGIAAIESMFIAAAIILFSDSAPLQWLGALTLAACLGFLGLNWAPAKLFMGDCGSLFLGLLLGGLSLYAWQAGEMRWQAIAIVWAVFVADTSATMLHRLLAGENITSAHNGHAYQILARTVGSHSAITLLSLAVNIVFLLPLAWYAQNTPARATICVLIAYAPLLCAVSVIRRRNFR